jgi:hypothetical protein
VVCLFLRAVRAHFVFVFESLYSDRSPGAVQLAARNKARSRSTASMQSGAVSIASPKEQKKEDAHRKPATVGTAAKNKSKGRKF